MLYINVYLVGRAYGGPEEGNWYYDVGTPLASIPVDSDYKPGKVYYLRSTVRIIPSKFDVPSKKRAGGPSGEIVIHDCYTCSGTGKVALSDDSEGQPLMDRCQECGLIPEKPEKVWKLIEYWRGFFKDTPGRREDLRVSLEEGFAQSFPDKKPIYE